MYLSKSKVLYYLNCPRRLWLEVFGPETDDSETTLAKYQIGHSVGEIARRIYDPKGLGITFDPPVIGYRETCARTPAALQTGKPVFEAGFKIDDAWCFSDVILPVKKRGKRAWRMIEVKSSGKVKNYHRDDVAIQSFIACRAGADIASVALAHVDTGWVFPGGDDYDGLLVEVDLTKEVAERALEVEKWISGARKVLKKRTAPDAATGKHCKEPWECRFYELCSKEDEQTDHPLSWLPRIQTNALKDFITNSGAIDMADVPDELLSDKQLRVKQCTISGKPYLDRKGSCAALSGYKAPFYFLDFETINFAVPIWKGTCPHQQIPFQYSLHRIARDGSLSHEECLDLSGKDPSRRIAEALVSNCGRQGHIFAYYASVEKGCIEGLAARVPKLREDLLAIADRIVDLHPIAEQHYYHPIQQGSWSLKSLLPAIAPRLSYGELEGVQNGDMAMSAYREAVHPETTITRKNEIEHQLLKYCQLDTLALVKIWERLA